MQENIIVVNDSTDSCNCRKSGCLKLYCQCFAARALCKGCNCVGCLNLEAENVSRLEAVRGVLERNPNAFESKFKPVCILIILYSYCIYEVFLYK